jgi:hypothetical protein
MSAEHEGITTRCAGTVVDLLRRFSFVCEQNGQFCLILFKKEEEN